MGIQLRWPWRDNLSIDQRPRKGAFYGDYSMLGMALKWMTIIMITVNEQLDDEFVLSVLSALKKLVTRNGALMHAIISNGYELDCSDHAENLFANLAHINGLAANRGEESIYLEAGEMQRHIAEDTDLLVNIDKLEVYGHASLHDFNVYHAIAGYDCVFETLSKVGKLAKKRLNIG